MIINLILNKKIISPQYVLKVLKNFPLRKLEETFRIAEFERPVQLRHINKIVEAMAANEFFYNILAVTQKKNGTFEVIDGQHRLGSLKELRDNYDVTHYDMLLLIFPVRFARIIYRRINLGYALKMQDHLRALDNNRHPFFTTLRPFFVHYNDGILPKFSMILSALSYAKNGSPRAVRPLLLDRMFKSITKEDLRAIISFSKALAEIEPHQPKKFQLLYSFSIYRNMFRVGYENRFNDSTWENFITLCKTDKKIDELHRDRKLAAVRGIYSHMIEKIAGQMGMKLERIERTGSESRLVLNAPTPSIESSVESSPGSASPIFFNS